MPSIRHRKDWLVPLMFMGTIVLFWVAGFLVIRQVRRLDTVVPPVVADPHREQDIQQAFGPIPQPHEGEIPPEMTKLLNDFGGCMRRGGLGGMVYFDVTRMREEIARHMPASLGSKIRRFPVAQLENGLGQNLPNLAIRMAYDSASIRGLRWLIPGQEAVVLARHKVKQPDGTFLSLKMRWWVVHTATGWKVYDLEEIATASRITIMMSISFQELERAPNAREIAAQMKAFIEGQNLLFAERFDEARLALGRVNPQGFPPAMVTLVYVMRAITEQATGDTDAALRQLDQAQMVTPDMPAISMMRANIYFLQEKYDKVIAPAQDFLDRCGSDAEIANILGVSLTHLNRNDEAAIAFGRSLDDEPDNAVILDNLRMALPAKDVGQLGPRLLKLQKPAEHLTKLVNDALNDENVAAADVFIDAFRSANPNHPEGILLAIQRHHRKGEDGPALDLFRSVVGVIPEAKCRDLLRSTAWRFCSARQALEVYEAVPVKLRSDAFQQLATSLRYSRDDDDDDDPEDYEADDTLTDHEWELLRLIYRHERNEPGDPRLSLHRAHLHSNRNSHDRAEELYRDAMQRITNPDEKKQARTARIGNLIAAKKALQAYQQIRPTRETFQQVARALVWNRQAELEPILALHRKADASDPYLAYIEGRLAYTRHQYARAVPYLVRYRRWAPAKKDDNYEVRQAAGLEIRCLALCGRIDEARKKLAEYEEGKQHPETLLHLLVDSLDGKDAAVIAQIEDLLVKQPWWSSTLQQDPEMGKILRLPPYRRLVLKEQFDWCGER